MKSISSVISEFRAISLAEMDGVKLMNRTDRKYWFRREMLADLLEDVAQEYYILEVEGERNLPYSTTYYDTPQNEMYGNHHRGKMNRYKIRRRNYISTKSSFLEVKFKSNKGRTIKVRRASDYDNIGFDMSDKAFIAENSPYMCDDLQEVLQNRFRRLMLVGVGMNERCTIDSEMCFVSSGSEGSEATLEELVVVEVKSDGRSHSAIIDALNQRRLKPSGFSKYCVGRSLCDRGLKRNNFLRKEREIYKKIDNPINSIHI